MTMGDRRRHPNSQFRGERPPLRLLAAVIILFAGVLLANGLIFILLAELFGWFELEALTGICDEMAEAGHLKRSQVTN